MELPPTAKDVVAVIDENGQAVKNGDLFLVQSKEDGDYFYVDEETASQIFNGGEIFSEETEKENSRQGWSREEILSLLHLYKEFEGARAIHFEFFDEINRIFGNADIIEPKYLASSFKGAKNCEHMKVGSNEQPSTSEPPKKKLKQQRNAKADEKKQHQDIREKSMQELCSRLVRLNESLDKFSSSIDRFSNSVDKLTEAQKRYKNMW
nr:unnamed protein product [Callosobruchus analis]